jgi:hypothetical protein
MWSNQTAELLCQHQMSRTPAILIQKNSDPKSFYGKQQSINDTPHRPDLFLEVDDGDIISSL